ncbi:MAG TPA: TolC family protein [Candidatus Limnocylindria bacterium]|nr:TolC family protein [Candidatus Limnocylindria bacterium]
MSIPEFLAPLGLGLCLLTLADLPQPLTLPEAEAAAQKNHPRISAAELRSLAVGETVTEARSAYLPSLSGNVTAATPAADNARIAAGGLNNPVIYPRAALGITASQLITDFGRTANLVATSKFYAKAANENVKVTAAQILLLTDTAYFAALEAQAVQQVASNTIVSRGLLLDRVTALAANQLKSELDVSFARVAYEEARLLQSRATNDLQAAFARLSNLLGYREAKTFALTDVDSTTNSLGEASPFIQAALAHRPDLARLRDERDAALKFAKAEQALFYPTVSAFGTVGDIPVHDEHLPDNYAAAGLNLNLPLFNGFNNTARKREAAFRAKAADETLREAENEAISDVRVAWLNVTNARERLEIQRQLSTTALSAFDLADARYRAGSSSMVELSQAQLNLTSAEIALASARYELLIQQAVLNFQAGGALSEQR